MNKIIILILLLALVYTSKAQLGDPAYEGKETNKYEVNVFCMPYLGPEGESVYLGDFFTGGTYTVFDEDEQVFVLEGATGMKFSVSSTTVDNISGVEIDYLWSINSTGVYIDLSPNTEITQNVTLPNGTGCDAAAHFKCKVTKLTIPATGIAPGIKIFNVTINAELIDY
ncbi:MAG: hypothetical protein N2319_02395 [Candidatus Kapabacteria bacterium]|nr:hypothetical protein [Candidatus Kapabacteria bacterium]